MLSSSQLIQNINDNQYEIELFHSVDEIPTSIWNELTGTCFYGKSAHLSIVEKVQADQMSFFYVLVKKENEYISALYFQFLNFSMTNAVNSWQNKNEQKCSVVYPFLLLAKGKQLPLIQSGNIFSTEDSGIYFSDHICEEDQADIINQVVQYLTYHLKGGKNIYFMLSGFPAVSTPSPIAYEGFHSLEIEPNLILKINSCWKTFDDYVLNMYSKYRQRVKKVIKNSEKLEIKSLSLDEIIDLEEQLLELYKNVAHHADFNMAWLAKGYFVEYKKLYQDDFEVKAYYLNQKLVGFTSSFLTEEFQYVHFIGMDYQVNEQIPMYHRMLFEFVRSSIQSRHQQIFLGRTATEIKTTIGAEPIEMVNYIKVQKAWYKCVLPKVLNKFGAKPYIVRSPFKNLEEIQLPV